MEKEFVPYEQALALKELGFNEKCFFVYNFKNKLVQKSPTIPLEHCINIDGGHGAQCTAPLYQQTFRWFRENHFLHSHITCSCTMNEILSYDWTIHKIMNPGTREENFITDYERTYEEAELECLMKLIEIVKNK